MKPDPTGVAGVTTGETHEAAPSTDRFGSFVGRSARAQELFADLKRIAAGDATLLIEGETGTGKDIVAEAVHGASARCQGPFVVFDCGASAPSLAESELFGHERGAFTGAVQARPGVFELAHKGTLFLDEIGELPKSLQPKLLRVLEKREVKRLGGTKPERVDIRILAATNRSLEAEVARGEFRQDLYYRVSTTHVYVPPLRERMGDIPLLLAHFLSLEVPPRNLEELRPEVWPLLYAHPWPGNVRELRNAVQRLLLNPACPFGRPRTETRRDANPVDSVNLAPLRRARREAAEAFERAYIRTLLEKTGGDGPAAARIAEVSRQLMHKLIRKHADRGARSRKLDDD